MQKLEYINIFYFLKKNQLRCEDPPRAAPPHTTTCEIEGTRRGGRRIGAVPDGVGAPGRTPAVQPGFSVGTSSQEEGGGIYENATE